MTFVPEEVYIREQALDYPRTREIMAYFRSRPIPMTVLKTRQRIPTASRQDPRTGYGQAKRTLVVTTVNTSRFLPSKPSADYQLPLSSGCPGFCEYCYLQTTLGKRPYVTVYVNIEEILDRAKDYMDLTPGKNLTFEGSCTSDPIPVESFTHSLRDAITFFGASPNGRFRFVTKYQDVEPLLNLPHRGKTRVRFSINTEWVVKTYEHHTPPTLERLAAMRSILSKGYPSGLIVAPVFLEGEWQSDYRALLEQVHDVCGNLSGSDVTFEFITHRFTDRAKNTILEMFPRTKLPLDPQTRHFRRGQFGYGKYLYPKDEIKKVKTFFQETVAALFPGAKIDYLV